MSDDAPVRESRSPPAGEPAGRVGALDRRLRREREARRQAESLRARSSSELLEAGEALRRAVREHLEASRSPGALPAQATAEREADPAPPGSRLERSARAHQEIEREWRAADEAADVAREALEARIREEASRVARGLEALRTGLDEVLGADTADAMRSGAAAMVVAIDELQAQALALAQPGGSHGPAEVAPDPVPNDPDGR